MSTVSGKILNDESSIEYDFPYSTQNTQSLSKYSKLEYNFPYSTQNTQSLSTTFHTRLKILKLEYRFQYSTLNTLLDSTQPTLEHNPEKTKHRCCCITFELYWCLWSCKKNLNASKPSEHPASGEKLSSCLGGNIGCRDKNSTWC